MILAVFDSEKPKEKYFVLLLVNVMDRMQFVIVGDAQCFSFNVACHPLYR